VSQPSAPNGLPTGPHAGLEWLKLLASLGITAFHLHAPGERLGYAGLPVFVLLTAALAVPASGVVSWRALAQERSRRLLLPWLFWCGFYAAIQCCLARFSGLPLWSWLQPSMLLVGTYSHLWYLPFAMLLSLGIGALANLAGPLAARPMQRACWLALGAAAIPIASRALLEAMPPPFAPWTFSLPAACFGIAIAEVPRGDRRAYRALLAIAGTALLGCAVSARCGWHELVVPYAVGVPAVALVWAMPWRAGPRTLRWTRTSFGIYLLHHAMLLLTAWICVAARLQPSPGVVLASVFCGELIATRLLRATPLAAVL
jgi:hypothetical protein